MLNPIKEFRQARGWSVAQLAAEAGITPLAVHRTEQGVFVRVPPSLISPITSYELITANNYFLSDEDSINEAYRGWQSYTRKANYGVLTETLPEFKPGVSPLVHWRMLSGVESQMRLCSLFCVHPSPIRSVETGQQMKLPTQLVDALTESGYDDITIQELAHRQVKYHAVKRN